MIKLLRTKYGSTRAAEFGPLSLKSLRDGMIELGWSRKTINQQINRIRRIFRWGVGEELVPPTVIQALDAVAGLRAGKSQAKELPPVEPVDDALVDASVVRRTNSVFRRWKVRKSVGLTCMKSRKHG